jgi:predicted nuclease of predicted toxin-antitoxin system
VRFLIDVQLPPALATRLAEVGHEATHVTDHLAADADDREVAELAAKLEAVLISKDEDFVDLSMRALLSTPFLWIRSGNMTTRRLWAMLEPSLPTIVEAFNSGERIVELR